MLYNSVSKNKIRLYISARFDKLIFFLPRAAISFKKSQQMMKIGRNETEERAPTHLAAH
jgi:hypothetical protein